MPLYEYICRACHRRSSILSPTFQPPQSTPCSHCGSGDTERAITTFAVLKSERSRQEKAGGPDYFQDSSNMGLGMSEYLQEEMGEAEYGEMDDFPDLD